MHSPGIQDSAGGEGEREGEREREGGGRGREKEHENVVLSGMLISSTQKCEIMLLTMSRVLREDAAVDPLRNCAVPKLFKHNICTCTCMYRLGNNNNVVLYVYVPQRSPFQMLCSNTPEIISPNYSPLNIQNKYTHINV